MGVIDMDEFSFSALFTSEVALVVYGGIAGYLLHVYKSKHDQKEQAAKEYREADKGLFQEVLDTCPADSSTIELIRHHDFYGNFHMTDVVPLEKLTILWDQPGKIFHDELMEKNGASSQRLQMHFL